VVFIVYSAQGRKNGRALEYGNGRITVEGKMELNIVDKDCDNVHKFSTPHSTPCSMHSLHIVYIVYIVYIHSLHTT
jgi:hypothetical protein